MENVKPKTTGEMTSEELALLLYRAQNDVQVIIRELEARMQRQNEVKKELDDDDGK